MNIQINNSTNFQAKIIKTPLSEKFFEKYKPSPYTKDLMKNLQRIKPEASFEITEFEYFNLDVVECLNITLKNINNNLTNKFLVKKYSDKENLTDLFLKKIIDKLNRHKNPN